MTRRQLLKILGSIAIAAPVLSSQSGCATWRAPRSAGLSVSCVTGEVTPTSALVWLRADPGSRVTLHHGQDRERRQFRSAGPFIVDPAADHTVQVALDNLEPASTYFYFAVANGGGPGTLAKFKTAPSPDDHTKVTFCFSGDTQESYRPFTIMNAVRAQQPDFFLHLGDTIYADRDWSANRLEEFWTKHRANRDDAASRLCFSEMSAYAVWDDHDVPNQHVPGDPLAAIGRKAFFDYWPIRRDPLEPERIYRSFRWGRAMELFVLDTRQYRNAESGSMLGKVQKEWLLKGIGSSTALFKFVATSVPMTGGGRDRWDGYPEERNEIIEFIHEKQLNGVVFLSADLHYAAITRIPGGRGLKDITAGPLAAPLNDRTDSRAPHFEYFSAERFNFAKITVDPQLATTQALVEFFDEHNRLMHRATIPAV